MAMVRGPGDAEGDGASPLDSAVPATAAGHGQPISGPRSAGGVSGELASGELASNQAFSSQVDELASDDLTELLSEFARTMITDFPIQGILDRLVVRIVEVLPVTSAGVALFVPGAVPAFVAASDDSALQFERLQGEINEGPCVEACRLNLAVAVPDLRADTRFGRFAPRAVAAGLVAVFAFPLRHGHTQLGALDLYRRTPGPMSPQAMRSAQTLADVAAAYVLNARSRLELQATADRARHDALHDPLTGLPNRVLLLERIGHGLLRAERPGCTVTVLMVDLDRFKDVNDRFGHRTGDILLVAVAERIGHLLRSGDTLGRLSGDEFVVVCEDLHSAVMAEAVARRIGLALTAPFFLAGLVLSITASVGVVVAGPRQDQPESLLHVADMAMYRAKDAGGAGYHLAVPDGARPGLASSEASP